MNQIFKVPNTEEGRLFLCLAKKYLNKTDYQLKLRGRTPNHDKVKKAKDNRRHFQYSVPLKYADNLGIYLIGKGKNGDRLTVGIDNIISLNKRWSDVYESGFHQGKRAVKHELLKLANEIER